MLFARALSNGIRWFTPDIYNGATVYTPDEMGALTDEEGNVVEAAQAEQNGNPDPIDDKAWDLWLALCVKAEKLDVSYPIIDREKTTKSDLRGGYKELEGYIHDAMEQAQAAEPA